MEPFSGPVDTDLLFRIADADGDGVVGVQDALAFFSGAQLPVSAMNAVWAGAVTARGTSALTRANFPLALALVALAQTQPRTPPSLAALAALTQPLPPPSFLAAQPHERARFAALFAASCDVRGAAVSGAKAREVLSAWPVPLPLLGRVWDLADADRDGALSRTEFAVALFLTEHAAQGKELPAAVPSTLLHSLRDESSQQQTQTQTQTQQLQSPRPSEAVAAAAVRAREALAAAETEQRARAQAAEAARLRATNEAARQAAAKLQDALEAETARGDAVAEQIAALKADADAVNARIEEAKAKIAAASARSAELVLEKHHHADELAQLREKAVACAKKLAELDVETTTRQAELDTLQAEARRVEAELAKTKGAQEEATARLESTVHSLADAALLLATQRSALGAEQQRLRALQQQEERQRASRWPKGFAFGPDFAIPDGAADPKESPFAEDDEPSDASRANVFVYEPFQ